MTDHAMTRSQRVQESLRATAVGRARRRPKTFGEHRVCADEVCRTLLSRYNCEAFCFQHAPARFRRLRGEFTAGYSARQAS